LRSGFGESEFSVSSVGGSAAGSSKRLSLEFILSELSVEERRARRLGKSEVSDGRDGR
jgi:hypothetical protein